MSQKADKVMITIEPSGFSIEAYRDRVTIAERRFDIIGEGCGLEIAGDDLYERLRPDLAATLISMELNLTDAVIALMPEDA